MNDGTRRRSPHATKRKESREHTSDDEYYKILGVERSASKTEIADAFTELRDRCMPQILESLKNNTPCDDEYDKAVHAYAVLIDDKKRRVYDKSGEKAIIKRYGIYENLFTRHYVSVLGDPLILPTLSQLQSEIFMRGFNEGLSIVNRRKEREAAEETVSKFKAMKSSQTKRHEDDPRDINSKIIAREKD